MSETKVVFTGNADQLLSEHKKVVEAKDKDIAKIRQLLSESKKYHSEEGKLQREAATALEKTRTAQQVYNDQVQKWFHLLAQHKINKAQFNVLLGEEKKKLDESTAATKRAVDAQKELSNTNSFATKATNASAEGFAFMAAKALFAAKAIGELAAEQKRQREAATGTVASVDELSRDYAVQAGLKTEDQRKASTTKIMAAARENAVTPAVAFETASQLASSGFKDVEGETLDKALKIIKTSDVRKGSPKEYIEGAARYLESFGMEMNASNLTEVGVAMRGIVDTPVQASDLAEFAEAAPELKRRGVDWKTGLAMMTELRKEYSGATSGTKMRNITQRLGQMKDDTKAMEALDTLGLKPEEVDAMGDGETMPLALGKINAALNQQPKSDHSILLGKLFNNENAGPAGELMSRLSGVEKSMTAFSDTSVFDAGVNFQLQGHNAEMQRADIDLQMEQLKDSETTTRRTILAKEIEKNNLERSKTDSTAKKVTESLINAPYRLMFGQTQNEFSLETGAITEEEALQRSITGRQVFNGWESPEQKRAAESSLDKRAGTFASDPQMAEQNAILKNIAGNQARVAEAVVNPANRSTVNPVITGRPK